MAYCERCDRYFGSDRALRQHKDNAGNHNICWTCHKDFSTAWGLTQHYVQSPIHDYCQRCDEHFDTYAELRSHYEDDHWYCPSCNAIFDTDKGLHEHNRQKHFYCVECKKVFQSESNLRNHLKSSVHQSATIPCPGKQCGRMFVSVAALVLHWEAGKCPSGITREELDRYVIKYDNRGVITNPRRLIRDGDGYSPPDTVKWRATERTWNGRAYECILCHREFQALNALNQHLSSSAHDAKIYRCPAQYYGCGHEFPTLSALAQHVESGQCDVVRFSRRLQDIVESAGRNVRMIGQ